MHHIKLYEDEQGFASIVIALIMIVVMALLIVGFAQLTRREEANTLDKQLSTQAYYAAESGINDILAAIQDKDITAGSNYGCLDTSQSSQLSNLITNNIQPVSGSTSYAPNIINAADGISYSCAIVALATNELQYTDIAANTAKTVIVNTTDPVHGNPTTLTDLNISWNLHVPQGGAKGVPLLRSKLGTFPSVSTWPSMSSNPPGVIEFSLTPLSTVSRQALLQNNLTFYMYPTMNGSNAIVYSAPVNGSPNTDGLVKSGSCSGLTGQCSISISNLSAVSASSYVFHMLDLYEASDVQITGSNNGSPVDFNNGQAVIDVTGRAKYALKRLQVRVPIDNLTNTPNYAIESQNICKREQVAPTASTNPNGTTFDTSLSGSCTP